MLYISSYQIAWDGSSIRNVGIDWDRESRYGFFVLILAWVFQQSRQRLGFGFLHWVSAIGEMERECVLEREIWPLFRENGEGLLGYQRKSKLGARLEQKRTVQYYCTQWEERAGIFTGQFYRSQTHFFLTNLPPESIELDGDKVRKRRRSSFRIGVFWLFDKAILWGFHEHIIRCGPRIIQIIFRFQSTRSCPLIRLMCS